MKGGRRVGIMGGTFSPIHNGHILLAQTAYEQIPLDKVLFMPSGNSYMKKNVLDTGNRIEMVRLAIKKFPQFELSLIEAQKPGNTYTYETLENLTSFNPDTKYYFIIGADSLFQIEKWRQPQRIFALATLVCAVRDDCSLSDLKKQGKHLAQSGADIIYLDMPKIDISSTEIREKARNSLPISDCVPQEVSDYIKQEHLYDKRS